MKKCTILCLLSSLILILAINCNLTKENPEEPVVSSSNKVGVLTGIVTDESTGKPLAGVIISVGSNALQTDSSGNYVFGSELGEGTHQLSASKNGYVGIVRTVHIFKDKSTIYSLKLFPKQKVILVNAAVGGSINIDGGRVLHIPGNALQQNTELTITNILGAGIPFIMPDKFVLDALAVEPHNLNFNTTVILQTNNPMPEINTALYKVALISPQQSVEEITGLSFDNNQISIPVKHFSYIYTYVDISNLRYRSENFEDPVVPTNLVLSCDQTIGKFELTIPAATITGSIDPKIITAQLGHDVFQPITRTLEVTRKKGDQKKQLKYRLQGTKFIFESRSGNSWIETATLKVVEQVETITENKGVCHDQGQLGG